MNSSTTAASPAPALTPLLTQWLAARNACRASRNKLGVLGYAYLAAMLQHTPSTAVQLRHAAQIGHMAAYRWLMSLYGLRRVHISGWHTPHKSPTVPIFGWGPGNDAPVPRLRPNGRPVQAVNLPEPQVCPSIVAWEYLLRAIESPASRPEVKAATGLDCHTLQEALSTLVALGLAHVPLWMGRDQGGAPLPQYQLGAGANARKPSPKRAEARQLHRTRQQRRRTFAPLLHAISTMATASSGGAA